MKTKTIILIGAAAIVTFSFTFANVNMQSNPTTSNKSQIQTSKTQPAGGFAAEEIVK